LVDIDSSHNDVVSQSVHQVGLDLGGIGDIEVGIISRVVGQSEGGHIELDVEGSSEPVVEEGSACRNSRLRNNFKGEGQSGSVGVDSLEVGGSVDDSGEVAELVFVEVVVQGESAGSRLVGGVGPVSTGAVEAGCPRVAGHKAIGIHNIVDNASGIADGFIDKGDVVEGVAEGHAV
jgi:hypothetical protein